MQGAPKIQKVLLSNAIKVSLKRIHRYMTLLDIHSIVVKKISPFEALDSTKKFK